MERYEVEWCSEMPMSEFGDADVDNAVYQSKHFKTVAEAETFARTLFSDFNGKSYPKLAMGCLMIRHQCGEIDADMLEVEGLKRVRWDDMEACELSNPQDEVRFEPVYHTHG